MTEDWGTSQNEKLYGLKPVLAITELLISYDNTKNLHTRFVQYNFKPY